mmetsp:Transcript_32033/g.43880  ORF Transcript_32033/g.43880 Transcript_32033/m.43880 type:complete len:142 (-) Transcript_32033:52-477(-)|eukprot:CAMPEP_0201474854 /NCGR_PEP_ID=MMETSP0151_2-20130828/315_1 /ASSEMBLY_ACC=CAM_ASM_000257 /TAXON_ID=200890 /ORGANISM="Paramoeba atlantica, Strain 621/1 / CCAP 1560/9" /LENGTH=141 /DNA_ID=CAMNT_0047854765 /DNA_START=42 /DNA_END=467 /DNA_ORIENTATION=+
MASTSVRLLEHRVKFFDGREDEVNDLVKEDDYKKWLKGKGAAAEVRQGTSQQESLRFKVEGAAVKGFQRTNKTSKFMVTVDTSTVVLGDFDVGEHTFTFDKQDIEGGVAARANWTLNTTFADAGGKVYAKRDSTFKIVGPS